jgi:hypothetical protein
VPLLHAACIINTLFFLSFLLPLSLLGPLLSKFPKKLSIKRYVPEGKAPKIGERKLYLFIEGSSASAVRIAKTEIINLLNEK